MTKKDWIPVKHMLPKEGQYVLACFDDGFVTGVGYGVIKKME